MIYLKQRGGASPTLFGSARLRAALARRDRGGLSVLAAVRFPALILLGGLAVDQSLTYYRYNLLQLTAASAAMAGQAYLSSYYNAGGSYSSTAMSSINTAVSTAVTGAMPTATYGSVVPTTTSNSTSNVQLGTWSDGSFSATTSNPNAVKVTALATAANGNAMHTIFGGTYGKPTVDMTVSAVASFGNGLSGAGGFNTIILNDLSMSFSSEIPDQRAADIAILNCISRYNGNGSVGLTSSGRSVDAERVACWSVFRCRHPTWRRRMSPTQRHPIQGPWSSDRGQRGDHDHVHQPYAELLRHDGDAPLFRIEYRRRPLLGDSAAFQSRAREQAHRTSS